MTKKVKVLLRSNRQLNKCKSLKGNNTGASLVTVLLIASIVSILAMGILAIVLLNVFMKKADKEGQATFYDAESAMEEIKSGLAIDSSKAASIAYINTLANYANLEDEKKTVNFKELFAENVKKEIGGEKNATKYKLGDDGLTGYLKETKLKGKVGAVITTDANDAWINVDKEGVTLKNVSVRYTDKNDYVSEIKTDIVLEYPPINFQNASSLDNILTYSLIANDKFEHKGNISSISGNAYLGTNGAAIKSGTLEFKNDGMQESNVISGGEFNVQGTLNSNNTALWADNLFINNGLYKVNSGSTYIKNDIMLKNNSKVDLAGKLIMYGNPWVASDSTFVESQEVREAAAKDMPGYSSAIVVSGAGAGIDLSKLNTLVIGGSAYIDASGQKKSNSSEFKTARDRLNIPSKLQAGNVVTGQSMALKSDQRAYLVPPSLVGAGVKDGADYENGFRNPMTSDQYNALMTEVRTFKAKKAKYDALSDEEKAQNSIDGMDVTESEINSAPVEDTDVVNFFANDPTLGVSLAQCNAYQDKDGTQGFEMPSFKVCAYPTSADKSMVYLFIQFTTHKKLGDPDYVPAEAYYNNWYRLYNSALANKMNLDSNLDYYTSGGIKLPLNINDKTSMYFTGNILATDPSKVIINDSITSQDFTQDLNQEYSRQSAYYQDAFYSLKKNLTTVYANLTSAQKAKNLFENLIEKDKITKKNDRYVSTKGNGAVVTTGDYTYNSDNENTFKNEKDQDGNKHEDAKINLIIATGNVTVQADYEGLIIAGGDIIVENGAKIKASPEKASFALVAAKEGTEDDSPAKVVINASHYLVGGVGRMDADTGAISLADYITYRNWTKQ